MILSNETSLLEFPTDFPIKVMGRAKDGFAQLVFEIVRKHAPDYDGSTMELRPSKAMVCVCAWSSNR